MFYPILNPKWLVRLAFIVFAMTWLLFFRFDMFADRALASINSIERRCTASKTPIKHWWQRRRAERRSANTTHPPINFSCDDRVIGWGVSSLGYDRVKTSWEATVSYLDGKGKVRVGKLDLHQTLPEGQEKTHIRVAYADGQFDQPKIASEVRVMDVGLGFCLLLWLGIDAIVEFYGSSIWKRFKITLPTRVAYSRKLRYAMRNRQLMSGGIIESSDRVRRTR
jgi:hypothetical protein